MTFRLLPLISPARTPLDALAFRLVLCSLLFTALPGSALRAQSTVCGRVLNAATLEPVPGAVVKVVESGRSTRSGIDGGFSLESPGGNACTLAAHHLAFAGCERIVDLLAADTVTLLLEPFTFQAREVVVRSTRQSPLLTASPYPAAIVPGGRLVRESGVTVADALEKLPGVALARDGAWETALSIRGMSGDNLVMVVDNSRMETSTDIAGALSLVNVHDLDRVEVLKSPGSVLYGSGAFGGVVHLISRRPGFASDAGWGAEYDADLSSVDHGVAHYAAVEHTAPSAAFRVSGGVRRAGDTMTPEGRLRDSRYHDFSLSAYVGVKPSAGASLSVSYQRAQAEDTGIPGGAPIASLASAAYTLARRELLGLEYATRPLTVRASLQEIDRNVMIVQSPVLSLTPHATNLTGAVQTESRLLPSPHLLLTVGAEAWQRNLESRRERHDARSHTIVGERPLPSSRFFSAGLYGQAVWQAVPESWTATLGARYDAIRINSDAAWTPEYVLSPAGLQPAPPEQHLLWPSASAANASWSAHGGLVFTPFPGAELSVLLTTAFRSPSLEERFEFLDLGSVVRLGNPALRPEQSVGLNTGILARPPWGEWRVDLFASRLRDLVADVPGAYEGRPAFVKANIGRAVLYGAELSGTVSVASWARVRSSVSVVRGEDTRTHLPLPQLAPLGGTVAFESSLGGFGSAELSCSVAARKDHRAPAEPGLPGYAVLDLQLFASPFSLGGSAVSLRAGARNLLNKDYRIALSTLRGEVRAEPGRNFVASVAVTL